MWSTSAGAESHEAAVHAGARRNAFESVACSDCDAGDLLVAARERDLKKSGSLGIEKGSAEND